MNVLQKNDFVPTQQEREEIKNKLTSKNEVERKVGYQLAKSFEYSMVDILLIQENAKKIVVYELMNFIGNHKIAEIFFNDKENTQSFSNSGFDKDMYIVVKDLCSGFNILFKDYPLTSIEYFSRFKISFKDVYMPIANENSDVHWNFVKLEKTLKGIGYIINRPDELIYNQFCNDLPF